MKTKLRRKFIATAMLALLVVLVLVLGSINLVNVARMRSNVDALLTMLCDNRGKFPSFEPPDGLEDAQRSPPDDADRLKKHGAWDAETPYETRYFYVLTDNSGAVTQINTGHIAAVTAEQARSYTEELAAAGKTDGVIGGYRYRVTDTGDGRLYMFLDYGRQRDAVVSFFHNCCAISAIGLSVVFLLITALSGWAIRPFIESVERQKRFIADAGHEIKTPLSIISANSEVIELTQGESEWTRSIRNQVARLNRLVDSLLTLSHSEEGTLHLNPVELDLSRLVLETCAAFEPLAARQGAAVASDIAPDVRVTGDADMLTELVSVLADNATKYVHPGGTIRYSLHATSKGARFEVFNTCDVPKCPPERLFDRFYREDASRSRESGGYGLGLAIARAIAEAHNGTLHAEYRGGGLLFTVEL